MKAMKYFNPVALFAALGALCLSCLVSCDETSSYDCTYDLTCDFEVYQESDLDDNISFTSDSLYLGPMIVHFGSLVFYASYDSEDLNNIEYYKGGWCLSRQVDTTVAEGHTASHFAVFGAGGSDESLTYAVFWDNPGNMPEKHLEYLPTVGEFHPRSCMVNNTNEVVNAIIVGRDKFEDGDYLTLVFTGYLDGKVTGKASVNLAEYRSYKHDIVTEWKEVDLSSLGIVDSIDFSFESSRPGLPRYFCLDDLSYSIEIHQ